MFWITSTLCQGTGASFLVTAVYFTFLFSCALLILTTAHFVIGAAVEKVGIVILRLLKIMMRMIMTMIMVMLPPHTHHRTLCHWGGR